MKDKPNDKFIKFLKIYGPWTGSNNQFDEYVSDNAESLGIEPFNFEIPDMLEYAQHLSVLIQAKRSHIVLISGQAGDGKTHMLRQMYTHEHLIGVGAQRWQEQLNNKELISSFVYGDIHYTVVRDLSTIDDDLKLLELAIPLVQAQGLALPKLKHLPLEALTLNDDEPQAKLEALKLQLDNYRHTKLQAPAPSADTNACHMLLIAGNNGKILERFKRLNDLMESAIIAPSVIESLERHMIHHIDFKHESISCFDLSLCLNEDVVSHIYDSIYAHERWSACEQCSRASSCPILFNRSLLLNPQVKERVLAMYHILADNGTHFTVRNILVELINALLGNKAPNAPERFFTCIKVFNATKEGVNKLPDLVSPPFDNLLGLNLTSSNSKKLSDIAPIFEQLDELKIGQYSNRLIDRFILLGKDSDVAPLQDAYAQYVQSQGFAPLVEKLQDTLNKVMQEEHSEAKGKSLLESMQAPLQSLRTMLFFTMPQEERFLPVNDSSKAGLFNPFLLTAFTYGQEYLQLKSLVMSATTLRGNATAHALIVGLNRAFTTLMVMGEDNQLFVTTNNELNDEPLAVVDDKDRFILRADFAGQCSEQVLKIVPSILLGEYSDVMCLAFYGKHGEGKEPTTNYQHELSLLLEQLQMAHSNGDDSATLSLSEHIERLQSSLVKQTETKLSYNLRSVKDPELKERYYHYGSTAKLVCYLKLTPKIFEYLMSLAYGKMSISFSPESEQALKTFKDNLLSYLGRHSYALEHEPKLSLSIGNMDYCVNELAHAQGQHLNDEQIRLINERINNIIFCTLDESGNIK